MAINLSKGQAINLEKSAYDLSRVTIGLGWDVRKEPSRGFLGSLFGGPAEDYDLDAIAFLLDGQGKVRDLGNRLIGGDVIFFNSPRHPKEPVWSSGDNRTGGGDGDDEQIVACLEAVSPRIAGILVVVAIYEGRNRRQHFGMVQNAFIRAVDARGREMARYNLTSDAAYANKCSMLFGELRRDGPAWSFRALGEPRDTDSIVDILREYLP